MSELHGTTAVITGGTGGAGRAVVPALAAAGVRCHVAYLDDTHRAALEASLSERGLDAVFHLVDVTNPAAAANLFRQVDQTGNLDFLVNLVGGFEMGSIEKTSPQTWDRLIAINATSVFLTCREAVTRMRPRRRGRIINVSAHSVLQTPGKMSAYVAAKAAVLAFTRSLAHEVEADGITANTLLPSIIDTPANRAAMPAAKPSTWVTPQQVADAVLFLLSGQASAINGAALPLTAPA